MVRRARVAVALGADEDVRREGREAAGDLPDMQVVDFDDPRLADERAADRIGIEADGGRLEEDASGGLDERVARADHQPGDQQGDDRIGALEAREEDHPCGDGGADEAVKVRDDVLKAALDVEAPAVRAGERQGGGEVDERSDERHDQDQQCPDMWRKKRRWIAS